MKKYFMLLLVVFFATGSSALTGFGLDNPGYPHLNGQATSNISGGGGSGSSDITSASANATYVKKTGDTMTGDLTINKDTPIQTFIDDIYAGTYNYIGQIFGTPTWCYFNGEQSDCLYFGGQTLALEAAAGGGFTMTAIGITWNPVSLGGNQDDINIVAPFAGGGSNLTGGEINLKGGASVGNANSSIILWGAMGSGNGNSTTSNVVVPILSAEGAQFNTSRVGVRVGGRNGTDASVGGAMNEILTSNANSGTGETQMHAYLLDPNTLASTGESLEFVASGSFATSLNNKQIKLNWQNATSSLTLYDSGACPITTEQEWALEATIIRVNTTTMKSVTRLSTATAATCVYADYFTGVTNFTRAYYLNLTGTGGASNDLRAELSKLWWSDS